MTCFPLTSALRALILLVGGCLPGLAVAQTATRLSEAEHAKTVAAFQAELNAEYRNAEKSPLPPKMRRKFKTLPFFSANYAG